jgi:hypothetical protein
MDKKSCENCGHLEADWLCDRSGGNITKRTIACGSWTRNPDKWLDILPTEPGWYFWKEPIKKEISMELVGKSNNELFGFVCVGRTYDIPVKTMKGQWQGPITPKGE